MNDYGPDDLYTATVTLCWLVGEGKTEEARHLAKRMLSIWPGPQTILTIAAVARAYNDREMYEAAERAARATMTPVYVQEVVTKLREG